jgi:hypothetical protein
MALGERPSPEQLLGVALILAGVLIAASGRTRPAQPGAAGREGVPQDAGEPAVRSSA